MRAFGDAPASHHAAGPRVIRCISPRRKMSRPRGECPRGGPHEPFYATAGTFTLKTNKTGGVRTRGRPKALRCKKCRKKL